MERTPTFEQATRAEALADRAADVAGLHLNGRLWLRAIEPVLQLHAGEPDSCPRVQHALESMLIVACEQAVRRLLTLTLTPTPPARGVYHRG